MKNEYSSLRADLLHSIFITCFYESILVLDKQVILTIDYTDQSMEKMAENEEIILHRKNHRLLLEKSIEPQGLDSVIGFAQEPLLSLVEACTTLVDIVHNISYYASIAVETTPNEPAHGLTRDESASIRLYTMEWANDQKSLYSILNRTLRLSDRRALRPWFKYLKLFLTALVKIPCAPSQTVWRGIRKNVRDEFPPGREITWWSFSSCTTTLTVLKNELYLGQSGERTLFSVEIINGRDISAHSYFATEDEILLLPGTHMEVRSQFNPTSDMDIIHLKQKIPGMMLLEPPFESSLQLRICFDFAQIFPYLDAPLYPINRQDSVSSSLATLWDSCCSTSSKRRWYCQKKVFMAIGILFVLCILAVILGYIFSTRSSTKTSGTLWSVLLNYTWRFFISDLSFLYYQSNIVYTVKYLWEG